jgi:RNA polymerase primary sigma factor
LADSGRMIRVPIHMGSVLNSLNQASYAFAQNEHRDATPEELSRATGVNLEEAKHLMKVSQRPASLNRDIGTNDDGELGDLLADASTEHPFESTSRELLKQNLHDALGTLTYREREILKLRYGLGDGYPYTLEQVGVIFQVTRERIRQIEARAFEKLKDPRRSKRLQAFFEGQIAG